MPEAKLLAWPRYDGIDGVLQPAPVEQVAGHLDLWVEAAYRRIVYLSLGTRLLPSEVCATVYSHAPAWAELQPDETCEHDRCAWTRSNKGAINEMRRDRRVRVHWDAPG